MDSEFGFIGLGLIGGSIAKALRRAYPDCRMKAYMRTRSRLEQAKSEGVIDTVLTAVDASFSTCDVIFLCTPVEYNEEYLKVLKNLVKPGAIITDVGSTKSSIAGTVRALSMEDCFVGGHPMAGSEKTGYENADVLLLENAYYMLCPCGDEPAYTASIDPSPVLSTALGTSPATQNGVNQRSAEPSAQTERARENLARMEKLVLAMKAIPFIIGPEKHDRVVATISHLPHLAAASLVNLVRDSDSADGIMKRVAAGGFKDITRIASSSPVMWEQICAANKDAILPVLKAYIRSLDGIREALEENRISSIHDLFESSGAYRNSLSDENNGLIRAQYSFSVHIADRPGSISILSSILAAGGINIKNIGINHNRETGEGALRVTFYDSESCALAEKQLKGYNYRITKS